MADLNYVSPLTSDLTDYYTKTEVDELQQGDAATYATTTQVDSKDNAVKNWVENKGYLTQHQSLANYATKTYVDEAIAGVEAGGVSIEVVNALPSIQNAQENVIYLVLDDSSNTGNIYNEWIYVPAAEDFEMIGNTAEGVIPDLTDYATKAWVGQQGYITSVDAKDVAYDNAASGLEASNVKNAIDEVYAAIPTVPVLATVATTGDYDDLSNKPTIPSLTGYATQTYVNDAVAAINIPDVSNFITAEDLPDVSDMATETWVSSQGYLTQHQDISGKANAADLATVATSGDYDDLTNKPSIPDTTGMATQTWVQNQGYLTSHQDISGKANAADLATVATSGDYDDLTNKPTIPSISGLASETYVDNAIAAIKGSEIDNDMNWIDEGAAKATAIDEIQNNVSAAGLSGDYDDLTNKPTIPTVPTNVSSFTNDAGYLTSHQDISGKVDGTVISGTTTAKIFNEADGGGAQIITASARGFAGVHDGSNPDATYATMYVKNAAGTSTLARVDLDGDGKAYYLKNGASKAAGSEIAVKGDIPDVSSFITSSDLPDLTGYVESSDLATVATSGDYDDLTNKPTIPSLSGYATETWVGNQGYAETANLATVATSGDYDDLTNKPTIPSLSGYATETWVGQQGYLTQHQDISGKANSADLATVATSGSYNDLIDKPVAPGSVEIYHALAGYLLGALLNQNIFANQIRTSNRSELIDLLNKGYAVWPSDALSVGYSDFNNGNSGNLIRIRIRNNNGSYSISNGASGGHGVSSSTLVFKVQNNLIIVIEVNKSGGNVSSNDFAETLNTFLKNYLLTYSNTNSGLTATTIQEAIDELAASAGSSVGYTYDSTTKTVSLSGVSDDNL